MAIGNLVVASASICGGIWITNSLTEAQGGLFSTKTVSTVGAGADKTVQGDPIEYQYGTIQVEVVRTGGKISAVNLLRADATDGRVGAFPSLVQAAIDAQSSNFGSVSGATFTTDAFKLALDSAISKLG